MLHDSHDNDILKINNGASQITVESNVFYNQAGSDEHIDINSVTDVVVQDNVFFNDFAGSGRANANDTSCFVVIKDSNGTDDTILGSRAHHRPPQRVSELGRFDGHRTSCWSARTEPRTTRRRA